MKYFRNITSKDTLKLKYEELLETVEDTEALKSSYETQLKLIKAHNQKLTESISKRPMNKIIKISELFTLLIRSQLNKMFLKKAILKRIIKIDDCIYKIVDDDVFSIRGNTLNCEIKKYGIINGFKTEVKIPIGKGQTIRIKIPIFNKEQKLEMYSKVLGRVIVINFNYKFKEGK